MGLFGVSLFACGIWLMLHHHRHWQATQTTEKDKDLLLFELRKFRRRGTVACLLSVSGCAMTALCWAREPRVFAILALFLFAALVAVLGLAMLDLMSVGIQKIAENDDSARKELVKEYHRLKKLSAEKERDGTDETLPDSELG